MRGWSEGSKSLAMRALTRGPLQPLANGTWKAVLFAQVRIAEFLPPHRVQEDLSEVTALIKTFERPGRCRSLLASIRRPYPDMKIVVVDDSRNPVHYEGVELVRLPFDSGVGAGRAAGLERVTTPFVLNLDDDFLFNRATRVEAALALLRAHPQLDLIGGQVIDLPLMVRHDFRSARLRPTPARSKVPPGTRFGPVEVLDKVPNFFLARTASIRKVGWDPRLKRLDHGDFFARAKGVLVSGWWEEFQLLHLRDPFDRTYAAHRFDIAEDLAILDKRYPEC